jgi:uncharacterized protein YdiU (UPF0061 family)
MVNKMTNFQNFLTKIEYSFMDKLTADPDSSIDGNDHQPREVYSGHFVPVVPTPIQSPQYIAHGKTLFAELGLDDQLPLNEAFKSLFCGDLSNAPAPMRKTGWATGYALSIFGTEYYQQCPFNSGNGYGDGRAISILEYVNDAKRWEMQLKGAGRTPYCRGADGRAVLRSSVREFLAQEAMHALGVPTARSLTLYVSTSETVKRPWYAEGSSSWDPDILRTDAVAISTRVAPSFIRVGQLELFGRRARKQEYPEALEQLQQLVEHLIEREYATDIQAQIDFTDKVLLLASSFRDRLSRLVAHWMRVGYCQGNFNSDNCAAGGFTLDYGPFGFCEKFDPYYQPWTGGGEHFAFWNQPLAAQQNFNSFCEAIRPLLTGNASAADQLNKIKNSFAQSMESSLEKMWAAKLGMDNFDAALLQELLKLMMQTPVDYTLFFRELSAMPDTPAALQKSFYKPANDEQLNAWSDWLTHWKSILAENTDSSPERISQQMKQVNPKYILREWLLASAYQDAARGDYTMVKALQDLAQQPYAEQSLECQEKYYRLRPTELSQLGGISHMSCSS